MKHNMDGQINPEDIADTRRRLAAMQFASRLAHLSALADLVAISLQLTLALHMAFVGHTEQSVRAANFEHSVKLLQMESSRGNMRVCARHNVSRTC